MSDERWHKRKSYDTAAPLKKDPSGGAKLYNTPRWKATRERFLAEHPLCVYCERDGRIEAARVADHIRPHRGDLGMFWDLSNLQPLCKPCHDVKTASETRALPRVPVVPSPPSCVAVLVCGPAGAGKVDYIRAHQRQGDLVIDLHLLARDAFGGELYSRRSDREWMAVRVERQRLLGELSKAHATRVAWITCEDPKWGDRRLWKERLRCDVIVLETPAEQCELNAQPRPHGYDWSALARAWWSCYSSGRDEYSPRLSRGEHCLRAEVKLRIGLKTSV